MIEVVARISIHLLDNDIAQVSEENEEITDEIVGLALENVIAHTGAQVDDIEDWYVTDD